MRTESGVEMSDDANNPDQLAMKFGYRWHVGAWKDGRATITHTKTCSVEPMPRNQAIAFYEKLLPLMIKESERLNLSPDTMPPTVKEVESAIDDCLIALEAAK